MRERRLGVHMEFSHLPQEDDLIHPYWFLLLLPAVETTCRKSHTSNKEKTRPPCAPTVCLPALGPRCMQTEGRAGGGDGGDATPEMETPHWPFSFSCWLKGKELLGLWPQYPPFFLNKTFSLLLTTPYSSGLRPQGSATTWFWYEHFSRLFLLH